MYVHMYLASVYNMREGASLYIPMFKSLIQIRLFRSEPGPCSRGMIITPMNPFRHLRRPPRRRVNRIPGKNFRFVRQHTLDSFPQNGLKPLVRSILPMQQDLVRFPTNISIRLQYGGNDGIPDRCPIVFFIRILISFVPAEIQVGHYGTFRSRVRKPHTFRCPCGR